ncbi:MAG TPA: hypothetical protein PKE32_09180 [Miltoncostaeaceae bacterium]|nr:hypothetical protein [Miltoncostaeaceae bacterium]
MGDTRHDDEDDDWPPPVRDPEQLEHMRREINRTVREANRRVLRWVYFGLAVLTILVIVLALTR